MAPSGFQIEDYTIERMLGRGGMGTVFLGTHRHIYRRAAIKLLHPDFAQDQRTVVRFLNEARAANRVHHPSIVQIYQFGQLDDGAVYIIMEYLEGELLSARIRRLGRLGEAALDIIRQIASALSVAHKSQVVHRDLKPGNIMIVPDPESRSGERVKVLDFGVAKLAGIEGVTQDGAQVGTPSYMAPEQRSGAEVSGQADVYALGLLLYSMLTGQAPSQSGELQPLRQLCPEVRPEVEALLGAMLAQDPAERPTMEVVAKAFERDGLQGRDEASALPAPHRWGWLVAAALAAIVVGSALTVMLRGGGGAARRPGPESKLLPQREGDASEKSEARTRAIAPASGEAPTRAVAPPEAGAVPPGSGGTAAEEPAAESAKRHTKRPRKRSHVKYRTEEDVPLLR